jgi:hypothetical protein
MNLSKPFKQPEPGHDFQQKLHQDFQARKGRILKILNLGQGRVMVANEHLVKLYFKDEVYLRGHGSCLVVTAAGSTGGGAGR